MASLVSLMQKGTNVGISVCCYYATIDLRVTPETFAS